MEGDNPSVNNGPSNFPSVSFSSLFLSDFPAGIVKVIVYCEGVIKATTQVEYYTAAEEIERLLQKVADPVAFACQVN